MITDLLLISLKVDHQKFIVIGTHLTLQVVDGINERVLPCMVKFIVNLQISFTIGGQRYHIGLDSTF